MTDSEIIAELKRELNRKSDAKRRNSPERKAWERERSKRRREAAKAAKTKESA